MHRYTRYALIVLLIVTVGSIVRTAPADITGTWTASFETAVGRQDYTYIFVVAKDGVLTGKAKGGFGESPLTEGKVKDDVVTFVEMLDGAIRTDYTGRIVSADEIQFTRAVGEMATEELVARRVKPEAK